MVSTPVPGAGGGWCGETVAEDRTAVESGMWSSDKSAGQWSTRVGIPGKLSGGGTAGVIRALRNYRGAGVRARISTLGGVCHRTPMRSDDMLDRTLMRQEPSGVLNDGA